MWHGRKVSSCGERRTARRFSRLQIPIHRGHLLRTADHVRLPRGITKNLEMATGVIILPQRQTVLFAKQAADVDLFSDGRLRLGVGVGWNWVEYDGLEMSGHFRRRSKRQEQ